MSRSAVWAAGLALACGSSPDPNGDPGGGTRDGYRVTHVKTTNFAAQPIADCVEFHGDPVWAINSSQQEGPCPSAEDRALCAACLDVPGGWYGDLGVAFRHSFYYEDFDGGCNWLGQNIVDGCVVSLGGRYETYHDELIKVASTNRPTFPAGVPLADLGAFSHSVPDYTIESDKGVLRSCKNSYGQLSEWSALGGEPTPCPDQGVCAICVLEKNGIVQDERDYDRGMGCTDDFVEFCERSGGAVRYP